MNNNMMNNGMINNNGMMMNNNNNMMMNNNALMQMQIMNNAFNNEILKMMMNMNINNFQPNNNPNNNTSPSPSAGNNDSTEEDDKINLVFKRTSKKVEKKNFRITIQCKGNELVSDVIQRYCFKTNEKKEDLLFLFNSKQLDTKKTVEQSALLKGSLILVVDVKPMVGGF